MRTNRLLQLGLQSALCLSLAACGGKFSRIFSANTTTVTFNHSQASSSRLKHAFAATQTGGVIVWGKSATDSASFVLSDETVAKSLDLANGDWTFYSIGWSGNSSLDPMKGAVRCGTANASLTGSSVTVAITLAQDCETGMGGFFGSSSYLGTSPTTPLPLSLLSCGSLIPANSGLTDCDSDIGDLHSYTVSIGVADPSIPGSSPSNPTLLTSQCQIHSGTPNSLTTTNLEVPVGSGNGAPITIIKGYSNGTCSGAPAAQFSFKNGLAANEASGNGQISYTATNTLVFLVHAAPTVSGTRPATIAAGTADSFVVQGSNFSVSTPPAVSLGSANCSVQVIDSQNLICTLPGGGLAAGTYSLTVTDPSGLSATLPSVPVSSGSEPVVSAIFPGTVSSSGSHFRISGSNFTVSDQVFIGSTPCNSLNLVSASEFNCMIPAGLTPQNYAVTVIDAGSGLGSAGPQLLSIIADSPPSISSISPIALNQVDTPITLSGSNFSSGATVTVGGLACPISSLSSTQIICTAPASSLSVNSYDVVVTNSDGLVDLTNLIITANAAPTLTSISPTVGHAGSTTVLTLTGTGFSNTNGGNFEITVGGYPCGLASAVNSTSVSCYTSGALSAGTYPVVLRNGDGLQTSQSVQFTTTNDATPTVSTIFPSAISSSATVPATVITITGTGFLPTAQVFVNGSSCSGVTITNGGTTISCTAPTGLSTGSYPVQVLNGDGQVVNSGSITVTTDTAPTISSIFPATGAQNVSTHVTVNGTGFSAGVSLLINGTACINMNYISSTTLTCDTPGLPTGIYDVVVKNPDNLVSTQAMSFTYSANAAPTFASASPSTISESATTPLTTITITGSNFQAGAEVYIGGSMCTSPTLVNSSTITCTAPVGMSPGNQNINILAADGQVAFSPNGYMTITSDLAPTVSNVSPTAVASGISTSISIFGSGFVSGATVMIGGFSCNSVTFVNGSELTCFVPSSIPVSTQQIIVTNPDGLQSTQSLSLTISGDAAPTIATIFPEAISTSATTPATTLTITGTNFTGTPTVMVGSSYPCTSVTVENTGTTITCNAPVGGAVGSYAVTVTNPDGQVANSPGNITITNDTAPAVNSIFPIAGAYGTATQIEINGSGFSAGSSVFVGGVPCNGLTFNSSSQLMCYTSSSLAIGTYDVEVVNPDNLSSPQVIPFSVSGAAAPSVSLVAPNTIFLGTNPQLTISGSNFSAGGVTVNLVSNGGNYACNSPNVSNGGTILTCTPPSNLPSNSYNVTVINSDGQAFSNAHLFVDNSFGNGSDGSPSTIGTSITTTASINGRTFSANRNVNNISAVYTAGTQDLVLSGGTISSQDFQVGDEIAWHITAAKPGSCETSAGSLHAGKFGFAHIASIDYSGNGTLRIDAPITSIPNNTAIGNTNRTAGSSFCVIQVVRVPNFENLSLQGGASTDTVISPGNFDMSQGMGGILVMRVAGTLTASSGGTGNVSLAADGAGFAGGACSGNCNGAMGDGVTGIGAGASDMGGNGATASSGAGGGGNGGAGGNGGNSGTGGQSNSYGACAPSASCASFGGGGGAGYNSSTTAHGASGGGIVLVYANNITTSSLNLFRVESFGGNTGGADASSPGGGAGGTALLQMKANSISDLFMSTSGTAASAGSPYGGGGGGGGFTEARYCSSSMPIFDSGSGSPAAQAGMGGSGTFAGSNGSSGQVNNTSLSSGIEYCP